MTEQKIDPAQIQAAMAVAQEIGNAAVRAVANEAMATAFNFGASAKDLHNEVAATLSEVVRLQGELKRVNANSQELIRKCDALIDQAEDDKAQIEVATRTLQSKDREIGALESKVSELKFSIGLAEEE